jgi:phosphatidylglycerophosphate synthase
MWLAHALTLSRIPIAIALLFAYGDARWAVGLIALAAVTDAADGNVARAMQRRGHTRPAIGGWLDPLVDKLFIAIVLAVIWIGSGDLLVIALIGARELVLVPLVAIYLAKHRPVGELRADPIGKAATVAQFIAVAIAIAAPAYALHAAAFTAVIGLAAVAHYVAKELRDQPASRVPRIQR